MKTIKASLICLAMCAAVTPCAYAQVSWTQVKWTDMGFVNATGGFQAGSHTLKTNSTFDLYDESGTIRSTQKVKGGGLFDISAGYKVWSNLAVAIGYSRTSSKANAAIDASVPHPAFPDQPRSVTASANGLKHTEQAVHFMAVWMMPITDKVDVGVSAGPSVFMVKQGLPGSLSLTEQGLDEPPLVTGVAVDTVKKTSAGLNLGVDVTYLLTKRLGVGGLARYTWGSVKPQGATGSLTVGGFQIGAGARVRF